MATDLPMAIAAIKEKVAKVAKKEAKESLHELSVQELQARLTESQEKTFRLRFQHVSNPLKNPMTIRTARREVARILTILRQKKEGA